MHVRVHAISLRLAAAVSVALLAFAAIADNEANCPNDTDAKCISAASHQDEGPPTAPAHDCAGRPCRTPMSVAQAGPVVLVLGVASTLIADPVRPLISAEPVAPPTPPPVDRR